MKQIQIQLHNHEFFVFEDDYITQSLLEYSCWEPNETAYFTKLFNSNKQWSFCDVGAHYGYYTSLHSSISHADNLALEANPVTYMMCLQHNVKRARHLMVGTGETELFRLANNDNSGGSGAHIGLPIFMKTCPLSALPLFDIYKIDVEGWELKALTSLLVNNQIPKKVRQIMVEITPANGTHEQIFSILKDNEFTLYQVPHKERGRLNEACEPVIFSGELSAQFNLIGVRK